MVTKYLLCGVPVPVLGLIWIGTQHMLNTNDICMYVRTYVHMCVYVCMYVYVYVYDAVYVYHICMCACVSVRAHILCVFT